MRANLSAADYEAARASLSSALDRQEYARFHYHEVKDRWGRLLQVASAPNGVWDIVLGGSVSSGIENENESLLHAIGAHVVACVQSLHAVPDILAHGVYFSLGLARSVRLKERAINAAKVQAELAEFVPTHRLSILLNELLTTGEFDQLSALSSHGKHRSIIKSSISADMTGADSEPIRLNFGDFAYDGQHYAKCEVLPFLEREFDRISKITLDTGIELHGVLKIG
jgi:hypothetical protein